MSSSFRGTTILSVRHRSHVVVVGDGQVSMGNTVFKAHANKVRTLGGGAVLAGFAGSTADAMSLFEKFEGKLESANKNLLRAAVELAKEWRTDRVLRRLEAMLLVADRERTLVLSGTGDIIEPDEGVSAIGSGGPYALSAARALVRHAPDMSARDIAEGAMKLAAEICVYTNDSLRILELEQAAK